MRSGRERLSRTGNFGPSGLRRGPLRAARRSGWKAQWDKGASNSPLRKTAIHAASKGRSMKLARFAFPIMPSD